MRRAATLGRDRDEVAQRAEPGERLALELADARPRQVELVADRLERPRLALEAEPQLEDPSLALRERVERLPNVLPPQRLLRLVELLDREAGRLRQLVLGRLATELDLQPARRAR